MRLTRYLYACGSLCCHGIGLLVLCACCCGTARAVALDLSAFQYPDKAITVHRKDADSPPVVDPYFAGKALIAALELGLDVSVPAHSWIAWMLPHQRPDGRLDRWCVSDNTYVQCAQADADDASLAVWTELIFRLYPASPVPVTWQVSLNNADQYLAGLIAPAGYYNVSKELKVGLLMDNAEVYSALMAAMRHAQAVGDTSEARRKMRQAEQLASSVKNTFWVRRNGRYRPSTQFIKPGSFYPEAAAQLYPLLAEMPHPEGGAPEWSSWLSAWRNRHFSAWLDNAHHDYPWGLIALAAWKAGDNNMAACWLARAKVHRNTERWNVLEEAIYQGLYAKLGDMRCAKEAA